MSTQKPRIRKRFDDTNMTNRMFFGFILSVLLALFGYVIWDRRTLMKPLEEKIINVERELEISVADSSKVVRLVKALTELSKADEKVADILKRFHLL